MIICCLDHVADTIGHLSSLEELRADGNQDRIADWPNLQKIDLRWVALTSIPPAIDAFERRGCRVLL